MLHVAENSGRLATETAFQVLARAAEIEAGGRSVINLGIGQPDFKTAPHVVEAAVKALRDGHHGYTDTRGILPLREAVAADLERRQGVTVSPDRVMIVPGGKVTIFFAVMLFGEPGAEIIYPDPGFPIYRSVIDYSGATAVPVPLLEADGFGFSAERVLSLITPRTRLIIVNSPANPTGGVTPPEETDALARGLEAHPRVAVLSDEIYARILYERHRHRSLLSYPALRDRVILLDGWSKTYAMTGWRLGFGVWPESLLETVNKLAVNCHSCVNTSAQYAGIAAIKGPRDGVENMLSAFAKRRTYLLDAVNRIPGVSAVSPGGAFYMFPNISATGLTARQLEVALLEEAGVATLAGPSFGERGEGFLRLSYANSLENIQEAVRRIEVWLGSR